MYIQYVAVWFEYNQTQEDKYPIRFLVNLDYDRVHVVGHICFLNSIVI